MFRYALTDHEDAGQFQGLFVYYPLRDRNQARVARAGGPNGELPSRERNMSHVLRQTEIHGDSTLPLANIKDEFISRSLYALIPLPRSMIDTPIFGACSAIFNSRIIPGEYFAASLS